MTAKEIKPYGRWPSEITPEDFANLRKISEPSWGSDGSLFWRERSSSITSIMRLNPDNEEITPISGEINVGGELLYGGGGYTHHKGQLIAVDKISHQLVKLEPGINAPIPITNSLIRAASPKIAPDGDQILFIHSDGENDSVFHHQFTGGNPTKRLVSGSDFYNYPRWHPSGKQIAWISWDHPNMPWASSSLSVADLDPLTGKLSSEILVAGGEGISIIEPEFSPDGRYLAYIADKDDWWQIYLYDLDTREHQKLTSAPAEHGLPAWIQDQKSYLFSPDSKTIYFLRNQSGVRSLWSYQLDLKQEEQLPLDEDYTWLEDISISVGGNQLALIASGADLPPRLITLGLDGTTEIIRRSTLHQFQRGFFSIPEPLSWASPDGETVKGLFYQPLNPKYQGEGKPPLIVIIHSGPTRQKWLDFQPRTQYFTSRGYAVLEVNYRGSTGYGRQYRQALEGQWGVIDVDDSYSGAIFLADNGHVDREKMVVMGSSSGGLTVYQILVKYPGIFRAGIILYGIVNHLSLLESPPKFERYYSDWLIGPYPEKKELYHQRSPIFFADRIKDPVAIFQGGKDRIVPPDQAQQIVAELSKNQVPYLYQLYPDEGHSFKNVETLRDFYGKVETFLSTNLA